MQYFYLNRNSASLLTISIGFLIFIYGALFLSPEIVTKTSGSENLTQINFFNGGFYSKTNLEKDSVYILETQDRQKYDVKNNIATPRNFIISAKNPNAHPPFEYQTVVINEEVIDKEKFDSVYMSRFKAIVAGRHGERNYILKKLEGGALSFSGIKNISNVYITETNPNINKPYSHNKIEDFVLDTNVSVDDGGLSEIFSINFISLLGLAVMSVGLLFASYKLFIYVPVLISQLLSENFEVALLILLASMCGFYLAKVKSRRFQYLIYLGALLSYTLAYSSSGSLKHLVIYFASTYVFFSIVNCLVNDDRIEANC